jgi:glycolate oxidase FAD binding subunit
MGLDDATAGRAMTAALATPFEVTGAAHLPRGAAGPETRLRLEGFAGSVQHRGEALARALADFETARIERSPDGWAAIRDAAAFAGRDDAVWRVSVKPTDGPRLGRRCPR